MENKHYDYIIEHHGVKGQKWGVRRALTATGHIVGSTAKGASNAIKSTAKGASNAIKRTGSGSSSSNTTSSGKTLMAAYANVEKTKANFLEKGGNKAKKEYLKSISELAREKKESRKRSGSLSKEQLEVKRTPLSNALDELGTVQKKVDALTERGRKQVALRKNGDTQIKGDIEKELWKAIAEQQVLRQEVERLLIEGM